GRNRGARIHDGWTDSSDCSRPLRGSFLVETGLAASPAAILFRRLVRRSPLRVNRVQVCLHARLAVDGHSGEYDAIANARITGPDHRRDIDMLRLQPEIDTQHSSERQRQHVLDIASVPAYVGGIDAHRRIDALVTKFEGKLNLMPVPAPAIGGRNRHRRAV